MDAKKAFDRLESQFLLAFLKAYSFGQHFEQWEEIILGQSWARLSISVLFLSTAFVVEIPLISAPEPLEVHIWTNSLIMGIKLGLCEYIYVVMYITETDSSC